MMARRAENKMRYHESDLNQIIAVRRTGLEQRARVEKTISARCLEQGQMVLRPSASWHRMLLRKDSEMWRHRMVRPSLHPRKRKILRRHGQQRWMTTIF